MRNENILIFVENYSHLTLATLKKLVFWRLIVCFNVQAKTHVVYHQIVDIRSDLYLWCSELRWQVQAKTHVVYHQIADLRNDLYFRWSQLVWQVQSLANFEYHDILHSRDLSFEHRWRQQGDIRNQELNVANVRQYIKVARRHILKEEHKSREESHR
ncbi:hypothetical protein AVEN_194847-1 [Araneus ventricosus]|uniref:Uncharacterized protein n=1 Tax=Araneus ventricosus TaxID=182803 RepID=A0A4Y2B458_ARAVE|nr:hypothetical protein AVEN_194847-1 [Araneus ventricosus]